MDDENETHGSAAFNKSSPFQHALALGMLLTVSSLAGVALHEHCNSLCTDKFMHLIMMLDQCMDECKRDMQSVSTVQSFCEERCKNVEPKTSYTVINDLKAECVGRCFPPESLVWAMHQVGSAIILLTMGFIFAARLTCNMSGCGKNPGVFYAWCFYGLAAVLFVVGLSGQTGGVQIGFIMSSLFSMFSQAVVEFRSAAVKVLDEEESAGFLSRRLGINPSIIGHAPMREEEPTETTSLAEKAMGFTAETEFNPNKIGADDDFDPN
mmetsp:Transcript_20139/g.35753  ORF Transcript_20139/g.35753 Transcript_20139/m.35753 type:complete len:266 (-) Transcript_20139:20-817(-)|eukprot:CAMPEP_0197664966 /NCGR_PEP_ID=MMETSP1338-20131121/58959_1 /TAXON_ID=43686 ORGANISM="Pelagodinium beii, Strain RCC1491" /NCGR_SAMPLE_ID=MMETSP1338 /ASSEMBLY_ACC=CAM_ASM_000754 /LENGTH=265 /DNA_ID=CAMNT_0043243707 /DNA_START=18 /DNA_END=815 /DNA_ORIENTATION=-